MEIGIGDKDIGGRFEVLEEIVGNKCSPDAMVDDNRVGSKDRDAGGPDAPFG